MITELKIFGIFILIGSAAALLFCLGGTITSKIKKRKLMILAESILLSVLIASVCTGFFIAVLKTNFGVFRVFMLAAMLAGFILTRKLFGTCQKLVYNFKDARKNSKSINS